MASLFESVMKSSNVWTGKDGVKGVQDILGNSQLQDKIQTNLIKTNYAKLVDSGAIQQGTDSVKSLLGKVMSDTGFGQASNNPLGSLGVGGLGDVGSSLSKISSTVTSKIDGIIGGGGLNIENKISGIAGSLGSTLSNTVSIPALDGAFASGGAAGGLGALANMAGIKAGIPASLTNKIDAISAEFSSDSSGPKKINQFKLAKLMDAQLSPQLAADATLDNVTSLAADKLDSLKASGSSAIGQFGSALSAAGVDIKTGSIPAVNAAFASGGISGAVSSLGKVAGSLSSSGTAKLGGLLENASKFGAGTAADWAKGALPSGDLAASMNSLAKQGEFAVNFSEMKLPSSVAGTSSLGAFVGTVDRKTLDSAVSKIVGSSKIGLPNFGNNNSNNSA
jgi:hypothetical protein